MFFEKMKAFGVKPDAATYNIMIDCCSLTGDLQSACALMTTMLQDGFTFHACSYTILIKIMLANDDFEAAINVFNEMKDEGIHSDVQSYNTIRLAGVHFYLLGVHLKDCANIFCSLLSLHLIHHT